MKWNSVKDKLPENGERVMALQTWPKGTAFQALAWPLIGCPYNICEFTSYNQAFSDRNNEQPKFITHWIPLPEGPNEVE